MNHPSFEITPFSINLAILPVEINSPRRIAAAFSRFRKVLSKDGRSKDTFQRRPPVLDLQRKFFRTNPSDFAMLPIFLQADKTLLFRNKRDVFYQRKVKQKNFRLFYYMKSRDSIKFQVLFIGRLRSVEN